MGLKDAFFGVAKKVIVDGIFDPSAYDWYCDECNAYLNEQDGFDPFCGTWYCDECGCENIMSRYNIFDRKIEAPDLDVDDEVPRMPHCCIACGGPYPNCMDSCKIFDD